MSAVELSLTDIMDKVVVDDWGQCRKGCRSARCARTSTEGKLTEDNLHAELGQIVAGLKPGRERDDETILFWHRGLSTSDIADREGDESCSPPSPASFRWTRAAAALRWWPSAT